MFLLVWEGFFLAWHGLQGSVLVYMVRWVQCLWVAEVALVQGYCVAWLSLTAVLPVDDTEERTTFLVCCKTTHVF